jgi:hypothetical protein
MSWEFQQFQAANQEKPADGRAPVAGAHIPKYQDPKYHGWKD